MKKLNFLYIMSAVTLLLGLLLTGCPTDSGGENPPKYGDPQKLLILQAYGSATEAAGVSHSFVELYNPETRPVILDGLSLQYAAGTRPANAEDPIATEDEPWEKIDLSGTINAKSSFLILGQKQNTNAAGSNAPRLIIADNYGDINDDSFILGNRSFKVVLLSNTVLLENNVQNPFDTDGLGKKAPGYIDMVGSLNDPAASRPDQILGFENAPARNSASESTRRKDLIDTNNNSVDFESIRYNPAGTATDIYILEDEDWKLEHYRPKNSDYGKWDPDVVPEPPEPPELSAGDLLILQAYGSASDAAGVSHSFVELFNTTNDPIELAGLSLQYAAGTRPANNGDPITAEDGPWEKINLTGTIKARSSFLILGQKQNTVASGSGAPRLIIEDGYGDINRNSFILGNRSFKVVLLGTTILLGNDVQNPFDTDGLGTKVSGYIDMVGAANDPTDARPDQILGFETAPARNSGSESTRRKNLVDTDNNSVDFESIRYNTAGPATDIHILAGQDWKLEYYRPKNSAYGQWDPADVPEPPIIEPSDNTLLILQAGAALDGAISHNFVELYNAGDTSVDLSGYSLQYADGTASSAASDGDWKKMDLYGIIPSHTSFLILGKPANPVPVIGAASANTQYIIPDASGDINEAGFVMSNRAFKIAVMSNTTLLTFENPFDIDGSGTKATGYIDMLGAINSDDIRGYETAKCSKMSKQQTARRISLIDTDNNNIDFTNVDYRGNATAVGYRTPKNRAYGAWNPITGEKE